jgi:hypothetical protein
MPKMHKLNALSACTQYRVLLSLVNLSSAKKFEYENFVITKPDKTTSVQLSVENVTESSCDVSWTTNAKGCLLSFEVIVKNKRNKIVQNITDVRGTSQPLKDLTSGDFTVQVTGFDDKGSRVPSNIANFTVMSNELDDNDYEDDLDVFVNVTKVDAQSAELSWNCTYYDMRDLNYHLLIHDSQGKSVVDKNISNDHSILVRSLKPCNRYTASVTVFSQTTSLDFTTKPLKPGNVTNFDFQSNATHSVLSWRHPVEHPDCVTSYTIDYKGSADDSISSSWIVSKNTTTLVVDKLPYIKMITFHVYANWSTSDANNTSNLTKSFEHFDSDEFAVENFREFRRSPTEVQILWSFNSTFRRIFKHFRVQLRNETITTSSPFINFEVDACEGKNYAVIITCISNAGSAGRDVTYQTQLNDSHVQLSAIDGPDISVAQTDETITIEWTPQPRERSCIAHYEVDYLNNVSIYERPRLEIHNFSPCATYQVGITPVSKRGERGVEKVFEFDASVRGELGVTF